MNLMNLIYFNYFNAQKQFSNRKTIKYIKNSLCNLFFYIKFLTILKFEFNYFCYKITNFVIKYLFEKKIDQYKQNFLLYINII